ncbi:hypothetical protein [Natronorubrum thiooxidans]|uniref:Uncharacterized protein n=1 Tax=Natronorubrum thiooxidans TaxID=308853 RepID=A0A1N7FWD5_9EURY|nr:hypothetical protein [Natronorubrum thiooxidans]SIS04662.1 hypothetical protein SAMN05421752_108174 [Natronorubrum thiooxidans]
MASSLVGGLGAICLFLAGVGLTLFVRYRWQTRIRRALAADLDERLAAALPTGTASHLEQSPTIRRLAVVDTRGDNETETPVYVPIVRVDLETTDAPGMKLLLEYVAAVLEAIHPVLEAREEAVHHYDVEFTFGPDGLFVEGECRRVSVAPELADQLLESARYGPFELWRDVKRADSNGDSPTALWSDCRSYRGRRPAAENTRDED